MDSNDFVFSDDVAESLGSRMADAAGDTDRDEADDRIVGSGKANFATIGALGSPS